MSNHHFHPSAGPCTILLFYYFISIGSRQRFFACRAANPTRPPHPSIFQSLFCISDSLFLHVGSRFCMSAKRIPCEDFEGRSRLMEGSHRQQRASAKPSCYGGGFAVLVTLQAAFNGFFRKAQCHLMEEAFSSLVQNLRKHVLSKTRCSHVE